MKEVISKNLYLEAYLMRESIKFFSFPEEEEEDTEERTKKFYEKSTGISKRPNNWNTACPPNCWETYKDVEDIFSLGRRPKKKKKKKKKKKDALKELISMCLEIFHKKSLKGERITANLQKGKTEWHESLVQ